MKVHIVTCRQNEDDKIVFLLNDSDDQIPRSPRGYEKVRGAKPFTYPDITPEQMENVKRYYTRVIDLRKRASR
jgi:hypothetical protein